MRDLINKKQEQILIIESEIAGIRNETKATHDLSERLHEIKQKFFHEEQYIQGQIQELAAEKKRLQEQ